MSSPTTTERAARVPAHLAAGGVVRQGDVVVLEPADDRAPAGPLPRAPAVEPEAPPMIGRDGGEEGGRVRHAGSRKFRTMPWPHSERIDSGWNCTPSSGNDTCRTPITTPSADHAVATSSSGRDVAASEW